MIRTFRGRALAAAGGLVICGFVLAGCAVPTDSAPTALPSANDPLNVSVTPPTVPEELRTGKGPTVRYKIYYINNGQLEPVIRTIHPPASPTDSIDAALSLLAADPTASEARDGITTYLRLERSAPYVVSLQSGVVTIELDNSFTLLSGTALSNAMGQIVYTVTGVPHVPVRGVNFELSGSPFAGYSPAGLIITRPLTRADYKSIAGGSS